MMIKLGYLIDAAGFDRNAKIVQDETSPKREWVEFNDTLIRHHTGNWPAIVDHCIS